MITDPNWLLATMAQSAAAMVAVIGGLLVSRVITLSSERRGLDRRVREIRERTDDKKSLLGEVRQNRQDISWEWFLDLAVEDSAKSRGNVSDEKLAEDHWVRGVPDSDEMLEMATALNTKMRVACRRIEDLSTRPPKPSSALAPHLEPYGQHAEKLLDNLGVSSPSGRLRSHIEQQLEIPTGEKPIYQAALDEIVPKEPSIIPEFAIPPGLVSGEAEARDYQKLVDEERELTLEVLTLKREEQFFAGELAKVARPPGLGWSIATLAYITTVGVVIPVVALATRPVPSGLASRRTLVLLFISGLVVLFIYLVRFGLRPRHRPNQKGETPGIASRLRKHRGKKVPEPEL